ncbi:UDP-glucose 4-epimerase [Pseudobutyrivibrio sp. C4]|uniref:NAD-dependent epimerase/dehydratase family protein n=1 Tax=Pseudobutyrivibrio sp. C4 TaxID=1520803 RepID=UPI0008C5AA5D|nr:NAD-dependent epimerase/dehydratase family protein [Pseudobutyrivibrio sp. C4]SET25429.1 UDP-glucose 4-epimerase [Pseudobutyrivibrio sp. C4]
MRVLILGGSGFIGQNLVEYLATTEKVLSFDLKNPRVLIPNVEYIQGDFFDYNTLEMVVQKADVIIHGISLLSPTNSSERYLLGYKEELFQSVLLCELVNKYNKKMIFLSSGGTVYGDAYDKPIKECSITSPINHYGNLKLCIENIIRTFVMQNGLQAYIARISNPYGLGQDYTSGVGFIDAVVRNGIKGNVITVWGDGENIRDYIHISDVCGMLRSLCYYEGDETVFNISSGIGSSQNKIIAYASQYLGALSVQYVEKRSVDVKYSVLDNNKIKSIYQKTLVDVRDGIGIHIDEVKALLGNK